MSIVDEINKNSGGSAKTISEAIKEAEIGKSGGGGGSDYAPLVPVYCIPGDYNDGDYISEEYLDAVFNVLDNSCIIAFASSTYGIFFGDLTTGWKNYNGDRASIDLDTGKVTIRTVND